MRTVIQVSDLHFGSILETTLEPLLETMWSLKPDLVIVSGDLTQRAKVEQFRAAAAYIARMASPKIVIPGNHDIPLYDVLRRFAAPLTRYHEFITTDMAPAYFDDELAVVGINSARSLTFKGGTLSESQVTAAAALFTRMEKGQTKIVVAHHPLDIPVGLSGVAVVHGAEMAVKAFARCGVDLFLGGHLHLIHQANAEIFQPGYYATILQAGTATSTRARGEPNSFFAFRIDGGRIDVDTFSWIVASNAFKLTNSRTLPARH